MKTKTTFAKLMSLALLVATLTIYTASRAGASPAPSPAAQVQLTRETEFEFGLVGIAKGQTARINAFSIVDPNFRPQPIEVEFTFHDRDGNIVAFERQTLLPEHAASFEIRGVSVPRDGDVTPCVKVAVGPELRDSFVCTLEVRDGGGKTSFALNNPRMHTPPSD